MLNEFSFNQGTSIGIAESERQVESEGQVERARQPGTIEFDSIVAT